MMTPSRFEDLLDRHGPDLAQWPAGERAAADALLRRAPEMAALLEADRQLRTVLADGLPGATAGSGLRAAILSIPLAHPRTLPRRFGLRAWLAGLLRPLSAGMATACAAGALGFVLGYGQLITLPGLTGTDTASSEASASDGELVASLAFYSPLETLP
ncbi:hypothetical protein [Oleisolibacter albus]|uniref:hypothetical protein n=1 Tax=Oleisolibacter albus TaxID=2171757 RepID=UPI0012D75E2A|nr:hypothetical protein [Oleisolibacter albus]